MKGLHPFTCHDCTAHSPSPARKVFSLTRQPQLFPFQYLPISQATWRLFVCADATSKTCEEACVARSHEYRSRWSQAESFYVGQRHQHASFHDSTVKGQQRTSSKRLSGNHGTTPKSEQFTVHRAALFADGVQKNKPAKQSGSVRSVYLFPVELFHFKRTSSHAVCVLCFTRHGFPVALVLKLILDDLVSPATDGI